MNSVRNWISFLFVYAFGIAGFIVVACGIYDLYRLRLRLYLHHRATYEELRGVSAERPRLFGLNPDRRELEFIRRRGQGLGDREVDRLRARVRRIPLNAAIVIAAGIVGGVILIIWEARTF